MEPDRPMGRFSHISTCVATSPHQATVTQQGLGEKMRADESALANRMNPSHEKLPLHFRSARSRPPWAGLIQTSDEKLRNPAAFPTEHQRSVGSANRGERVGDIEIQLVNTIAIEAWVNTSGNPGPSLTTIARPVAMTQARQGL